MTDDDLGAEVRRTCHVDPPPGFSARIQTSGFGAWAEHRTFSLRAVVMGTAAVLLVVGISARIVTLHWHPTSNPVAVAHTHQSPASAATAIATGSGPSPNVTLPAVLHPAASATPSASVTPAPVPECQATDVAVRVTMSSAQYTVGQTVSDTATFTNVAAHPCGLPPCAESYSVSDASGHVVAGDRCSLAPAGAQPTVLAPAASTSLGPREIPTGGHMGAGTYTLSERWGYCKGAATFTLVASGSASTPTPTPTATATPLLP